MGIKRIVDTSFWTDGKVDEFSPEDKYFMLYLLTNPFSKQLGIYEISVKQVAFHMGYSVEAVHVLLDRFENKYKIIVFSKETNEVAILNFLRHSVMKGGKPVEDCIKQDMAKVKNKKLIDIVFSKICDKDDLNVTVKKIVNEYMSENDLHDDIDNDNDDDNDIHNDNDNDRTWHESYTNRSKAKTKRKTVVYYPLDERLNLAFTDYVEMRKKIKHPMTERAIELAMKRLGDMSNGDNDVAVQILDQSVLNSWKGLFPLKEEKQQTKKADDFMDMWRNA